MIKKFYLLFKNEWHLPGNSIWEFPVNILIFEGSYLMCFYLRSYQGKSTGEHNILFLYSLQNIVIIILSIVDVL